MADELRPWALILGGADCLWEDVDRLGELLSRPWPGIVIATNDAGVHWPGRLDHWVTLHPEKFERVCPPGDTGEWLARRSARGHPGGFTTWSRRADHIVDRLLEGWNGGSSGLFAVAVAHHLGVSRAVLCGVPMDERRHFHEAHGGRPWEWADKHWQVWLRHRERIAGWVRSMSGRTREQFGLPTLEWLEADDE